MKFKIDQNLPVECASTLVAAGHDAITVYQQQLGGAPDQQVVAVCRAEGRILITSDLDLSDITHYPPAASPGYVVYRTRRPRQAGNDRFDQTTDRIAHPARDIRSPVDS